MSPPDTGTIDLDEPVTESLERIAFHPVYARKDVPGAESSAITEGFGGCYGAAKSRLGYVLAVAGTGLSERCVRVLAATQLSVARLSDQNQQTENLDVLAITEPLVKEELSNAAMRSKIEMLFRTANQSEDLEEDRENGVTIGLAKIVETYEIEAISDIGTYMLEEKAAHEGAAEVLRELGKLEHQRTHGPRRRLLERILVESSSIVVRDGANLGLAFMDDPTAIPTLKSVIDTIESPLFRKALQQTVSQLESTEKCHAC